MSDDRPRIALHPDVTMLVVRIRALMEDRAGGATRCTRHTWRPLRVFLMYTVTSRTQTHPNPAPAGKGSVVDHV